MRTFRRTLVVLGFVGSLFTSWFLVLANETIDPNALYTENPGHSDLLYIGIFENDININDTVATFNPLSGNLNGPPLSIDPTGRYPYDATLSQDGSQIWLSGAVGDGVVVVDSSGQFVIEPINGFGEYPVDIAFSKQGEYAYIANRDTDNITVIDTDTRNIIDDFDTSGFGTASTDPGKMAIQPCTGDIYMADWFDDFVFRIDAANGTLLDEIDAGVNLWDLVFSPDGETLYATDRSSSADHVIVIDTATFTVTNRISVGDDPWGIAISPDGSTIVTANEDDGTASIIDTGTMSVVETITLGGTVDPRDVDINSDGTRAYIPSGDEDSSDVVYVIDLTTNTLAGSIDLGSLNNPNVVSITPDTFSLDPVASFTSNSPVGNPSIAVEFVDTSLNEPTSWEWDFGDGLGTSTLQNPSYAYANEGTYDVSLSATNECGTNTITQTVKVGIDIYLPVITRP